jgi:hypothetical protein
VWKDSQVKNDEFILIGNDNNYVLLPIANRRDFDVPTRFTSHVASTIANAINAKDFTFIDDKLVPICVTFTVLDAIHNMEIDRGFTY